MPVLSTVKILLVQSKKVQNLLRNHEFSYTTDFPEFLGLAEQKIFRSKKFYAA